MFKESILSVSDNCGIFLVKCFGHYQLKKKKNIKISKFIKVSYRSVNKKFINLRGKKSKAFYFLSKKFFLKKDGSSVFFLQNSCVLLKKRLYTRGRLISGPCIYNLKRKKFINSFNFVI